MSGDAGGHNVEIIRSNKGGFKLIHMGYMYTVHKRRQGGGIRWRCSQRSLHCKGSISTGAHPPQVNMTHNHSPDPHSVMLARSRQAEDQTFADLHESNGLTPVTQPQCSTSSENCKNDQPLLENGLHHSVFSENGPQMPMAGPIMAEVCLRWNSHHANIKTTFPAMLKRKQYVDCTVSADGGKIKCHKLVLSSCSAYFDDILCQISPGEHPVVFLKEIPFWIVKALIDFMYQGEIHIEQNRLKDVLEAAEVLKVKGLTGSSDKPSNQKQKSVRTENDPNDSDIEEQIDPMQLLQNSYSEPNSEMKERPKEEPRKEKKLLDRKVRLNSNSSGSSQKYNDKNKANVACITTRKGTKSRPVVKAPKYYHNEDYNENNLIKNDYINSEESILNIKAEPVEYDSERDEAIYNKRQKPHDII